MEIKFGKKIHHFSLLFGLPFPTLSLKLGRNGGWYIDKGGVEDVYEALLIWNV